MVGLIQKLEINKIWCWVLGVKDKSDLDVSSKMRGVKSILSYFVQLFIVLIFGVVLFYTSENDTKNDRNSIKKELEIVVDTIQK